MHRMRSWLILFFLIAAQAWADEQLPAFLIRLPASVETVFVAETSAAAFHRFERADGMRIEYRGWDHMSIGKDGAGKERSGDRRTPLGVYFVTEQLDTSQLHEKYGATAFPLDYPNVWDRRQQRSGDGIWVHGVDPRGGERPPRDTDGCIALSNEKLLQLENRFVANVTPVVIAGEVNWVDREKVDGLRAELETVVAAWADSLQRGDMHAYLTLYDDDFRHWNMNKDEWTVLTVQTLGARSIAAVAVSDLLLLGDPEEKALYLSRFRFAMTEGLKTVESRKRLYWRRSESGALRIIAEDSG